jgi:FAD/FMN-containing dehydrogenase
MNPESWGRYPNTEGRFNYLSWRNDNWTGDAGIPVLPRGNGRSYGDVCLNDNGILVDTLGLDRFIRFDTDSGVLCCESGVLLSDVLALVVPLGWFLTVTPGTQYITVGGAIANDVHGKNHHRVGTFGNHVRRFELRRSDGNRLICSAEDNTDWYRATIGGLGLTGLITWAELQLRPITNPYISMESIRFDSLADFMTLSDSSDQDFEYTVAWIDCQASGGSLGRGIFMRGNHANSSPGRLPALVMKNGISIPPIIPGGLLNRASIKLFNSFYYWRHFRRHRCQVTPYVPFFYPLDKINNWNRLYGKKGFLQYQCVVPRDSDAMHEILKLIVVRGYGSFLAVLKQFGDIGSPGMMSFPRPGLTLALDFPNNRGKALFDLLEELDGLVCDVGGAVYPAKDARMSARSFSSFYPDVETFGKYVDPKISSSFWRRVTSTET